MVRRIDIHRAMLMSLLDRTIIFFNIDIKKIISERNRYKKIYK